MGFIFQQFHLVPHLNALENVMLAQYFHSMVDEGEARLGPACDAGAIRTILLYELVCFHARNRLPQVEHHHLLNGNMIANFRSNQFRRMRATNPFRQRGQGGGRVSVSRIS